MDDDERNAKLAAFTLGQLELVSAVSDALEIAWRSGLTKQQTAEAVELALQARDFLAVIQSRNLLE
jgi:hypothetical protein